MTEEEVERFLKENPMLVAALGAAVLQILSTPRARPEWLKDCAPVHQKRAGPWRGKGSFGKGFGSQVKRKS